VAALQGKGKELGLQGTLFIEKDSMEHPSIIGGGDVAASDACPYEGDNDRRDRVKIDFGLGEVGRWKRPENGLN
jgi:hypothetical protein